LLVDLRNLSDKFIQAHGMETSGYNLRQRPFLASTTADCLATIMTILCSVSTVMSYPSTSSSSSTGGATLAPTYVSQLRSVEEVGCCLLTKM